MIKLIKMDSHYFLCFKCAIVTAGAVPLPNGSNNIDLGLILIFLSCSAAINLCYLLQIKIGLLIFLIDKILSHVF